MIKVSDYIAEFLIEHGITTIFTVVGGGAMHLNDSFGNNAMLNCIYNHHEQASSMAAEAYYRVNNKIAVACVTSGPGAINALNGVAGAYQDSIPMLVFSGQCKSALTVRKTGEPVRCLGPQEFDIVSALDSFTKYAEMVLSPEDIKYCLERALFIAKEGRPGPCWLDIPLDIQGAYVDPNKLRGYVIQIDSKRDESVNADVLKVIEKLRAAKRPVLYVGNGVRIAGAVSLLREISGKVNLPVVTCWDSIDVMETDDPMYIGRAGIMGDRAGNFAVQNSDCLIAIGNRLSTYQVGYQLDTWARKAFVIMIDVDEHELKKSTIRVDLPLCYDAYYFLTELKRQMEGIQLDCKEWIDICHGWKEKYPVALERYYEEKSPMNVYAVVDSLSRKLPEGMITVVGNGSASVVGSQTYHIGKKNRFIMNCAISSMGYDLPAAIGVCVATGRKDIVCLTGDGSIQMNLQELQTIVTNKLPIKIIVINNDGYHQIRITQTNLFDSRYVGIGPQSGGVGFPNFEKLAYAYGIPYFSCADIDDFNECLGNVLKQEGYCLFEVFCSTTQFFEPKSATKRLADGSLYSPPLEDMAPFLPEEEVRGNMLP